MKRATPTSQQAESIKPLTVPSQGVLDRLTTRAEVGKVLQRDEKGGWIRLSRPWTLTDVFSKPRI